MRKDFGVDNSAKEAVRCITYSQKTCSQWPTCKYLSWSWSQAILHFQDEHPEEDSRQVKFLRMNLHREITCAKCKSVHVNNPIKLSCSNDLCEACLLDLMYSKEVEASDHLWEFQYFIRCPFCNGIRQVDSMAADSLNRLCGHSAPTADESWIEDPGHGISACKIYAVCPR